MTTPKTIRILRQPEVLARTGLSKSTIYQLIKEKQFKPPIKLGARAVGWLENDIDEFLASCIKASRPDSE